MNVLEARLGRGNIKLGPSVPTFSLPSGLTCPGATRWCLKHCYAFRMERLRGNCRRAFSQNLVLSWHPSRFIDIMVATIPSTASCMRIHVGGDFYARSYVDAWRTVCENRPQTRFWAYTHSWSVPALLPALERLNALANVQVFASVDPDMPPPPSGFRLAFVATDPRASGLPCPHQFGSVASCVECGHCFRASSGNVIFKVH